jgi:hypothetical protein
LDAWDGLRRLVLMVLEQTVAPPRGRVVTRPRLALET